MNTMTFTIESVHGVKQTLVLGLSVNASATKAVKEQSRDLDRDSGTPSGTH